MPRILYISGSGRSGSTLVERLLHSTGRVFSTGELHVLWRLPAERITCACGAKLTDCATWRDILRAAGTGPEEVAEMARLEGAVCRTAFVSRHRFDLDRLRADPDAARFLNLQRRIFDGIARATGKEIVVDSSKAGPRAALLSCLEPPPALIHIWRDPADVIASWRSRKFDAGLGGDMQRLSAARAAADWMKAEFFARSVARRRAVAFVNYATFCASPRAVIAGVGIRLGLGLDDIAWTGAMSFQPGTGYHSLNGNPDRFAAGPVDIVPRAVSRAELAPADRAAAALLGRVARLAFPAPEGPVRAPGHTGSG